MDKEIEQEFDELYTSIKKQSMFTGSVSVKTFIDKNFIAKTDLEEAIELKGVKDLYPDMNIYLPTKELSYAVTYKDGYNKALKDLKDKLL